MKGQLSAEMLILIAVVIAVVAIAAMQMMGTAKDTGERIDMQAEDMYERTSDAMKGKPGQFCTADDGHECLSGRCDTNSYECE